MLTLLRYVIGPLTHFLCILDTMLRNFILMRGFALLDSTLIVRYIFTLHSKNPTAVQDDFWTFFINIWINGNRMKQDFLQAI